MRSSRQQLKLNTLVRYFTVSAVVYVFILAGMYIMVDMVHVSKIASYVVIYFIAYLVEYIMTLTLVFRSDHAWLKVFKFVLNTALFVACGALLFRLLLSFRVDYLVATLGAAAILLPFRFLANKKFVYR